MSSVPLAVERAAHADARRRDRPLLGAWALAALGLLFAAGAVILLVVIEQHGVPDEGRPRAGHVVVRVASGAGLLVVGALMLAHLPRHPLSWIFCAAALGTEVAAAGNQYAVYSHFVRALPAGEWAGWFGEWASFPIVLVPGAALLLFPDGRLPGRRWRAALWCGVAGGVMVGLNGALGIGEDLTFQGNPLLPDATARALGDPFSVGWGLMLIAAACGIAAIATRRRTASAGEREQLRLLGRGALIVSLAFLACAVVSVVAPAALDFGAVAALSSLSVLAVLMGVAILRHRLYGLDVYVDRAMVLTGTTLVLGALYVVAIVIVARLFDRDVDLGATVPATVLVAVAFRPLRDRLQRSVNRLLHGQRDEPYAAISQLGRRLGEAIDPTQVLPVIAETIADALRLPYVAVELAGSPIAAHGVPAAGIALRLPLVHAGEHVGTLVLGARAHGVSLSVADRQLLEDFARRASAAASAVALSLEIQRSRERLVTAREEERRRLRGDLHDGLGPTLAGAVLTIDAARRVLTTDPAAADALLDRAAASVEGTVADVRRVVYALRPPALDQLGLIGALHQQAATLRTGDPQLEIDVNAPKPMPPLTAAVEVAAYRIAQEALTNVTRHARARHASITIAVDDVLALTITDDGCGLPEHHPTGVGLTSMRERATELGGKFAISRAANGGTLLAVRLPLHRP